MKNIVIDTAKGGNLSLENKNISSVCGKPHIYWPLSAANEFQYIDEIFVSAGCPYIREVALNFGAKIIDRPQFTAKPDSNYGDVILHDAKQALSVLNGDIATVTILLGNTVMLDALDIDLSVNKVLSDYIIDSAMTVWQAQDDHPLRAMIIEENGYLSSF